MVSTLSKIINSVIKLSNIKEITDKSIDTGKTDNCLPPKSLNAIVTKENGRNVYNINIGAKTTIIYLHGGVYVHGFSKIHWSFIKDILKKIKCRFVALDYPLAPTATYKDSFEMIKVVYSKLVLEVGKENIIFMGDSSGAGFALAFAQMLGKLGPIQIILLSPWLDITLNNPEIKLLESQDPILSVKTLRRAGKLYAGETDTSDYRLSPINGDLSNLGKISIFSGTNDILNPDAKKLVTLAKDKGITINYKEYKEQLHTYMFFHTKEAKMTIDEIVKLIKRK